MSSIAWLYLNNGIVLEGALQYLVLFPAYAMCFLPVSGYFMVLSSDHYGF